MLPGDAPQIGGLDQSGTDQSATTGSAGLIGATSTVPLCPLANSVFGCVSTADSAALGVSQLLLKTDGRSCDDYAWARLVHAGKVTLVALSQCVVDLVPANIGTVELVLITH
jgi:hypothetical protein